VNHLDLASYNFALFITIIKDKEQTVMENDLHLLKNIGNTTINWLEAIEIHSQQQLSDKGAVEAYFEIKQLGIRVSKVLLYALHGAIIDTHWNELDPNTKQTLLNQVEDLQTTTEHG
jgi:DNA transformation protein